MEPSDKSQPVRDWLRGLLGHQIVDLKATVHVPVEGSPTTLMTIGLWFSGGGYSQVGCASDGESVKISSAELETVDMGELGGIAVQSCDIDLAPAIGATIVGAALIEWLGCPIGFELHLSNQSHLRALNVGDDLVAMMGGDHPILHEPDVSRLAIWYNFP